jgi:hypothetical protein
MLNSRIAVYGPVRTVVWEGRESRGSPPIPISPGIYPWDSGRRIACPPRDKSRGYVPAPTRGEMREHQVGAVLRAFLPPGRGQAPPLLWVIACTQVNAYGVAPRVEARGSGRP